jgi:hypothetical protein
VVLATLVGSFTGTVLYAAAVIAAPFPPLAALATLVFVPAMFNIPMLLEATGRVDARSALRVKPTPFSP